MAQKTDQLGIFAKYWEPGRVKTRLAASIGAEHAASIYAASLRTLLERFGRFPAHRRLLITPPDKQAEFIEIASARWTVGAQSDGDLGQRMESYFAGAFRDGQRRTVLIGSDSPTLPLEYIETAFDLLQHHRVVLGPADDGGYYLVGASEQVPPIFSRMHWSTASVWERTVERLESHSISWTSLPPWYDVDDEASLHRLMSEIQQAAPGEWSYLKQVLA